MKKLLICCTLAGLSFSISCGCSTEKSNDGGQGVATGTVVTPKYSRSRILKNPLNGWVMYAARTAEPTYWDTQCYVADIAKTVLVRDYASAAYIRTSWRSLEPTKGVYTWRDPNTQMGRLVQGAIERGLPVAFRIVVDGRDQGANTPQFVYDDGAQYWLENDKYPDRKTPYPQDKVFQKHYEDLIKALAEDFNDPAKTSFIDAYGLGKWGEGHNVVYEAGNQLSDNTERLKEEVMEWITKLYAKYFTRVPLVINYHRLIGHITSEGSANPNSEKLLGIAINNGYSLRSDAFGMNSYYGSWEKAIARSWNYRRPILMEGGWIVNQHSYWNDPAGYRKGHPEDVRKGEFDASAEAHVNMMDFRAGDETLTWFENAYSLVTRFATEGGYRIYPDRVVLPSTVTSGSEVMIEHRWHNMGWGYFPNNIPQWNYKYKVAFALLDAQDQTCGVWVDKDCEPSTWINGEGSTYQFSFKPNVSAGSYRWAVAVVDTENGNRPAIELPLNDPTTDAGWTILMDVEIK